MGKTKIGILYNTPLSQGQPHWEASADVLTQVEAVEDALTLAGLLAERIPFTREPALFFSRMQDLQPDAIINLCETVDEEAGLAWHPAAFLELMGIPFSGSPSSALMLTTDKLIAKRLLRSQGIETPNCCVYSERNRLDVSGLRFPVIVKPRFEDASIGIDQESIFEDRASLAKGVEGLRERFGSVLVEEYVRGREFNVSLFGFPEARPLPVAEIDFSSFPKGLYRIVGYRAKWETESFEYRNTPRLFPGDLPQGLLQKIEAVASTCFEIFQLRDYGRVDLRVDENGPVHVLEVNANPCLSPDAGLAAAYRQAGGDYAGMISRLVGFTLSRKDKRLNH